MAARKINPGTLFDGEGALDGSSTQYVSLVDQYMATEQDMSTVLFVRARIAAVVGTRGVLGLDGEPMKMAEVAEEWGVAPSTFSNARRSFGTLRDMGFDVLSARPSESVVSAHSIVKDRMRKMSSAKIRVTLANGEHTTGKAAMDAVVSGLAAFQTDSDDVRLNLLNAALDGVTVDGKPESGNSDTETFLDALARFQSAHDRFVESGSVLSSTQAEFLATALAAISAAHEVAAQAAGA